MAFDFDKIVAQQEGEKQQKKLSRQAERDNLSSMGEAGIMDITSKPDTYMKYLTMQAGNDLSPQNLAAIMAQNPDFTMPKQLPTWNALGYRLNKGSKGVKAFAKESGSRYYDVVSMFDVSQVSGPPMQKPQALGDKSPEMQMALAGLAGTSPVKIMSLKEDKQIDALDGKTAIFDPASEFDGKKGVIFVNAKKSPSDIFQSLSAEIFHASCFRNNPPSYQRDVVDIDAQSVSYMLCSRIGVTARMPDASQIGKSYEGLGADARKGALGFMKKSLDRMSGQIARVQQQARESEPVNPRAAMMNSPKKGNRGGR